jgi:hypothetical protein
MEQKITEKDREIIDSIMKQEIKWLEELTQKTN